MPEVLGHAPLLLGLVLVNQNNNKNNRFAGSQVVTGTVVAHEQIAEANYLYDTTDQPSEAFILRLRGRSANPEDLTQEQHEFYNTNGYLILPQVLTAEEAISLLNNARDVMKRISEGGGGIKRYDVSASGGKLPSPVGRVLATFENANNTEISERSVARLGCGIHQCLPFFRLLTHLPRHRLIAKSLGCGNPRITQSQIIAKHACVGGSVVPHQDGCISFTNPTSSITFWYALEDATLENGCLCVAPGSHLTTPLSQRLTKGDNGLPKFEDLKAPLWAGSGGDRVVRARPTEYEYKPLQVKKGSLILFHGNLMHTSGSNKSGTSRIAYTFSIIDSDAKCPEDSYMKPLVGDFESL